MLRIDDIHAFGVIGTRRCQILLNLFAKCDIIPLEEVILAHYFTFGASRIFHFLFPTSSKPWTDSDRHTVGDDLPGVPINSAQTGRRGRRPLQFKIICKTIDAKAFWTDSDQ